MEYSWERDEEEKNIKNYFSKENLELILKNENIDKTKSCGIDKISSKKLIENKEKILGDINKSIINGTYKFTPYKIKLISKGPDKAPRVTCIPTIKDRIVIATIKRFLYDSYPNIKFNISANTIVRNTIEIKEEGKFDCFIKLDLTNFFGSIDQELLIEILRKQIKNESIIKLIKDIITNPRKYTEFDERKKVYTGIPQGLSISVLLANIYLHELDEKFEKSKKMKIFRYVDDILIFCNEEDAEEIKSKLIVELKMKYSLQVNKDKYSFGKLTDEFEFLGYRFFDDVISVRKSSKIKFEQSLETMFKKFSRIKDKNEKEVERFIWMLNYKICGIVNENKRYGWLYYYSCITDEKILYELDGFIIKLIKRFKLEGLIDLRRIKKFVKAYHEIKDRFSISNYLLKYNNITFEEMCDFIEKVCGVDLDRTSVNGLELERKFKYCFFNMVVKKLERDLDDISR